MGAFSDLQIQARNRLMDGWQQQEEEPEMTMFDPSRILSDDPMPYGDAVPARHGDTAGWLTREHPASSRGLPVWVPDGRPDRPHGPAEAPTLRVSADLLALRDEATPGEVAGMLDAAEAAGYRIVPR